MKYRFVEGEPEDRVKFVVDSDYALINGRLTLISYPRWKENKQGALIRSTRKSLGITLRKAAEVLGISGTELTRIETGRYVLSEYRDFQEIISKLEMK